MTLEELLERQNKRSKTKLTVADVKKMGADYAEGVPLRAMIQLYGISQQRIYALFEAAGIKRHTKAEATAIWHKRKAQSLVHLNSRAQTDEGFALSTPAISKPPRHVKAASTPRSRWVDLSDGCPHCDSLFDISAPAQVANRLHIIWQRKHPCTQENRS